MDLTWNVPGLYLGFLLTLVLALAVALIARRLAHRLDRLVARLTPRAMNAILVALIVVYCLVFGGLSLLRHEAFHSKAYDLGIFSQTVWNTSQGRLFQTSLKEPDYIFRPNYLSIHLAPILAFFAPLYWLLPDPRVLLIIQTVALALGALPVYWLARQRLPIPFSLVLPLVYLLLPSLHFTNLWDFHPFSLIIPFLLFATYGLLQRRYGLFAVFLFLALLCQEDVAFMVVGFGLYLILAQRRFVSGAILAVGGLLWGYVAVSMIIPALSPAVEQEYSYLWRYGYLGKNLGEVALTLLTRPLLVLEHVLNEPRLRFVLHLLIPFGFTPLAGLEVLALAGIPFVYLMLSAYDPMYSIQWHYTSSLIPFVTLSAVVGCARLLRWRPSPGFRWALAGFLLVASLGSYVFVSPGPLGAYFNPDLYDITTPRVAAARAALALIPADSPVMAQSSIVPHLAERTLIRLYPEPLDLNEVEYVVCDPGGHIYGFLSHDELFLNMERLDANPYYERIYDRDGITVFRRRDFTPPVVRNANFGDTLVLLGYDLSSSATAEGDVMRAILYWRGLRQMDKHYKYFVHLLDRDGRQIAQEDREPGNWRFPTTDWMPGETILERYEFALPAGANPKDYRLRVGVYATETGERLPVRGPAGETWTELLLDWP